MKRTTFWVSVGLGGLLLAVMLARSCREDRLPVPVKGDPRPPEPEPGPFVGVEPQPQPEPSPPPPPPPVVIPPPPPPPPVVFARPKGFIVRGTVKALGDIPRRRRILMASDPSCGRLQKQPLLMDDIVVDRDRNVRWAFVYVKYGAPPIAMEESKLPIVLDQSGCRYDPHVLGVQVGQPFIVRNSDDLLHNVHALGFKNREWSIGQPVWGTEDTRTFASPEVMVPIRCDIHPWMNAWVGVLDHPYFAVTDASGAYAIQDLPQGRYTIEVWHERYAPIAREVFVPAGQEIVLDIFLDALK